MNRKYKINKFNQNRNDNKRFKMNSNRKFISKKNSKVDNHHYIDIRLDVRVVKKSQIRKFLLSYENMKKYMKKYKRKIIKLKIEKLRKSIKIKKILYLFRIVQKTKLIDKKNNKIKISKRKKIKIEVKIRPSPDLLFLSIFCSLMDE